ncbi:polysaccharide biosynthesis/export family protein [Nioella aestuarii]|uniref:polysaccharide biosynthesis/export family protein n=1 Tax=Nioella aestuarii TaxID=1662864 RepID=UPI003D7F556B
MASRGARLVALLMVVTLVATCGLPRTGPNRRELFAGSVQREGDAFVVSVNDRVLRATALVEALGFSSNFVNAGQLGSDTIRPGDTLSLSIWENVTDPLLGPQGSPSTVLDDVQVDGSGFIFIPYAGRVRAAGNTPDQLRQILTRSLDEQTPDPQIIVRRVAGNGATVSVAGVVGAQGIFPIDRPTRTLSAMLAAAGGVTVEPEIARVTVVRGGETGTIWFNDLYSNPELDIALRAGDRILVEEDTRSFTALGATNAQTRVPFDTQTISAIEAIATVGGLNPNLADPTGVFILRNEPEAIARQVLGRNDISGTQRMIYVLDLTEPNGMFQARDFVIRDQDTLYVTVAPFAQWNQVIGALTGTLATAGSISSLAE